MTVASEAECGDQRDREQDVWKGHHGIDDPRDNPVSLTEEARNEAERDANGSREQGRDCPDKKRQLSRINRSAEDVAAEFVGAEPPAPARGCKRLTTESLLGA